VLTPRVAALLAAAEAAEWIARDVRPRMVRGDVVLADRYAWTAVARDVARGLDPAWAGALYRFAPAPDLVVFHRQDTDAALVRALATRPVPAGAEAVGAAYRAFLERLVAGYERLIADPGAGPWAVPVLVLAARSPRDERDTITRERVRQAIAEQAPARQGVGE
jgi:dTMP kinase